MNLPRDENGNIETHGLKIDFGKKHKGELVTRVPFSFLAWMINANHTHKEIAEAEIKRRGSILPTMDISGHAIDRASIRLMDWFGVRENKNQGLYAWLEEKAREALEYGEDKRSDKEVIRKFYLGIVFVFKMDGVWPVLKSVFPKEEKEYNGN